MSDTTFITNEGENTLEKRLARLLENAAALDILVGYFRASGFDRLARHFAPDAQIQIRILVGISADPETARRAAGQLALPPKSGVRKQWAETVENEMADSLDSSEVERGARQFLNMLKDGRLTIRAHPDSNLHAKLHIITFAQGDRDIGRVITGSSNLTESGIARNLEFNVELKLVSDHEFALNKFNQLWENATDISVACRDALQNRTWLRDDITPRELYLKFLRERFRAELDPDRPDDALPGGMMQLEYQRQAVRNAERIIASFGGVFLSDVVGLGKTYMAAMLARRLGGNSVVVAPPAVLEENSPGSWPAVFRKFKVPLYACSIGRMDNFPAHELEQCENFFVDEAHRFRSGDGERYRQLANICRGKRVILVTATPFNNRPDDILSLLSLFQPARESVIPGVADLKDFFAKRSSKIKNAPQNTRVTVAREVAADIRRCVSRFVTVRRTRAEIAEHFPADLRNSDLKFPVMEKPEPLFYKMDAAQSAAFDAAIAVAKKLTYARYRPLDYLVDPKARRVPKVGEQNLVGFVKTLLVKRLESSFTAFRGTVDRMVESHRNFIRAYEKHGSVYFSKRDAGKIMECLDEGRHDDLQKILDEGRGDKIPADHFTPRLEKDLKADLGELEKLQKRWREIETDPKLERFAAQLKENKILRAGKIVIFTESTETADRLTEKLREGGERVLLVHSGSSRSDKREAEKNFDASIGLCEHNYRILVATEALSEGVNLHAAHAVVNYDIPWNPTRLMQRAGRINRVGGTHDRIHIFNFFPTGMADGEIGLIEKARVKIAAFVSLLGGDFRHLTEDESVDSHRLFDILNSAEAAEGEAADEDESELKYLREIEKIRDEDPALFERIENLPRKARAARRPADPADSGALLTYFKAGKLDKYYLSGADGKTREISFTRAAAKLRAAPKTPSATIPPPPDYFRLLNANRAAFDNETAAADEAEPAPASGSARQLANLLRAILNGPGPGADAREFLSKVAERLKAGAFPAGVVRAALKALRENGDLWDVERPDSAASAADLLREVIPTDILNPHRAEKSGKSDKNSREVILSEFFAPVSAPQAAEKRNGRKTKP